MFAYNHLQHPEQTLLYLTNIVFLILNLKLSGLLVKYNYLHIGMPLTLSKKYIIKM